MDDESAWTEAVGALEPGATVERESAPLGPGRTGTHGTVRFAVLTGESAGAARARAAAWLSAQQAPTDGRFALEELEERDDRVTALRTVVLTGAPILTAQDVESAVAVAPRDGQDAQVMLWLTPAGARRFEEATGRLVRRRMAILTNGVVRSVPVVMSKITGGRISITLGRGNPDTRYREAQALAEALGGDPR